MGRLCLKKIFRKALEKILGKTIGENFGKTIGKNFWQTFWPAFAILGALAILSCQKAGPQNSKMEQNPQNTKPYNPRVSPLPERTPRPLEEWGIDNGETIISHTFSSYAGPIYPPDATHFDYVNPNAPQGGTVRLASYGEKFTDLSPYSETGYYPYFYGRFDDSLMRESYDEVETYYPLVAEKIEYAKDFSYVIFHIDPRARFPDGQPITAEDVVFSLTQFNRIMPGSAALFAETPWRILNLRSVRFNLAMPNRRLIVALTELPILWPKFWRGRSLADPLEEVPLGSGAWKIADYEMGEWILYEKRDDYWASDLLVNRGLDNFRYYRIEHYPEDVNLVLKAFLDGEFDFRTESVAQFWARHCRQIAFAHISIQRICTAARNDAAFLAYRVAIPRQRLKSRKAFSIRCLIL